MPDAPHLLIPFAACTAPPCQAALAELPLPHMDRLLMRLQPEPVDTADEYTLTPPHDRALAAAFGMAAMPDGCLPWAAWDMLSNAPDPDKTTDAQAAYAFITPCHWNIAADHIALDDPDSLQLDEAQSRELLALMQPYFAEDGITLRYSGPTRWIAQGEVFRDLATASLDRVVGRDVDIWMPDASRARPLRRLQSEMQMLLYTSPFNDQRAARGLAPVNSFWVSGSGALPASLAAATGAMLPQPIVPRTLAHAALRADWRAWADAWCALDAGDVADLLRAVEHGSPATLTLCGERSAQTWRTGAGGAWQRLGRQIKHVLRPQRASTLLGQL